MQGKRWVGQMSVAITNSFQNEAMRNSPKQTSDIIRAETKAKD